MNEKRQCLGMEGAMGRVVCLFREARENKDSRQEEMAEQALEELLVACGDGGLDFSYATGMCGVGVGVEYLLQQGYVEGDANEVLAHFDSILFKVITSRPPIGAGIRDGLLGLAYYFYFRLRWQSEKESERVVLMKEYVIYLIDWIGDELQDADKEKNLYEFFFVLVLLLQLNVFNAKVLNLLEYCQKEIAKNARGWKR